MKKRKIKTHLKRNGILLMIAASLFFSVMGALVKYATEDLPSMEAVFFRAAVTLIIITPWMIYKKIPLLGKNRLLLLTRSAFGFIALGLTFYVTSKIHLADVSILNRTSVLFVALLSAFFLREKVSAPLIIYIICAFLGAAMVVKPQLNMVNIPGLLGLAAGFFAAIAYVSVKALHKTESFFTIVFSFSFFSTFASLIFFHQQFVMPQGFHWFALIGLGLCGTIAQLLMTYAYKHTEASIVTPYSFITVIFSALWGMFFWGEIPDIWSAFGGILIIACGIGIVRLKKAKGETAIEYEDDWADEAEVKA